VSKKQVFIIITTANRSTFLLSYTSGIQHFCKEFYIAAAVNIVFLRAGADYM